jgi:hypothetical protein
MAQELSEAFSHADFPEVIRAMDRRLGESSYSLRTLFKDEQRKVLDQILESTLSGIEAIYRQQYETNYPLVRFLIDLGNPIPKSLYPAVEFIVNTDLRFSLSQDELDLDRINGLLEEARVCNVHLDSEGLGLLFRQTIEKIMERFVSTPEDQTCLEQLVGAAELARAMPFEVDLWKVQNLYYRMLQEIYPQFQQHAQGGDAAAQEWVHQFVALGGQLSVRV